MTARNIRKPVALCLDEPVDEYRHDQAEDQKDNTDFKDVDKNP